MNSEARHIITLARQLGFTVAGVTGSGHIRLDHVNGQVTIASTPSEYRGRANTIAQLERVAGRKLPRAKHRRGHKRTGGSGFSLTLARRECETWHDDHDASLDALLQQREQLIEQAHTYAQRRGTIREIPELLTRIAHIERRVVAMGQAVETFDPFTLRE